MQNVDVLVADVEAAEELDLHSEDGATLSVELVGLCAVLVAVIVALLALAPGIGQAIGGAIQNFITEVAGF
jgi:hypothetical protein